MKPNIINESKGERFKRLATVRTNRILNDLRVLGNCANRGNYEYNERQVAEIFDVIEKQVKTIKNRFNNKIRDRFQL